MFECDPVEVVDRQLAAYQAGDLAGFVAEAQQRIDAQVRLPEGYRFDRDELYDERERRWRASG